MRTTVTLDSDVERMLRDTMHRERTSFKKTLNAAIRAGLSGKHPAVRPRKFMVKSSPLGLRTGIDPVGLNKLADDLEAEAFLEKTRQLASRMHK